MSIRHITLFFLISIISLSCTNDNMAIVNADDPNSKLLSSNINVLSDTYAIDDELNFLLINGTTTNLDSLMLIGADTIRISNPSMELKLGEPRLVSLNNKEYKLYSTELPIIEISTKDKEIVDEPKILSDFKLLNEGILQFESRAGIELRGLASLEFPKKSYNVELWKDDVGEDKDSESLLGLRKDDDWILDGLWNEPLRIRDYTAWEIWLQFGRYPYKDKKKVTLGIKREYVELFIDNSYRGAYYLGEKVDRKQLDLVKFDGELQGELYKGHSWDGGTLFTGLKSIEPNSIFWNGYEAEYPDDRNELNYQQLYDLVNFTVEETDGFFEAEISNKVYIENMVDYFIFINLFFAADNMGRNMYTAKYKKDTPYFIIPWDLDGTAGNDFSGKRHDATTRIVANGLFDRLLTTNVFKEELKKRWKNLKRSELSVNSIMSTYNSSYQYLLTSGIYDREQLNAELPYTDKSIDELEFINSFFDRQFLFFDTYIDDL